MNMLAIRSLTLNRSNTFKKMLLKRRIKKENKKAEVALEAASLVLGEDGLDCHRNGINTRDAGDHNGRIISKMVFGKRGQQEIPYFKFQSKNTYWNLSVQCLFFYLDTHSPTTKLATDSCGNPSPDFLLHKSAALRSKNYVCMGTKVGTNVTVRHILASRKKKKNTNDGWNTRHCRRFSYAQRGHPCSRSESPMMVWTTAADVAS